MKKRAEQGSQNEITQPAVIDSIPSFVTFVSARSWEAGLDDTKILEIERAVEEALGNIINFSFMGGKGEISINCTIHDSGAFIINIVDTGTPFNMLLADTFPETADFFESGKTPSTRAMKKAIKNIEYRRGTDRNTLVFTVTPEMKNKN